MQRPKPCPIPSPGFGGQQPESRATNYKCSILEARPTCAVDGYQYRLAQQGHIQLGAQRQKISDQERGLPPRLDYRVRAAAVSIHRCIAKQRAGFEH